MSDQPITVRLSRADAVALRELFDPRLAWTQIDHQHTLIRNLRNAIKTALAAPAEGPERAATGETLVRCGRCGVPFPPHPDPARFDHDFCEECLPEAVKHWGLMHTAPERLAAIGGGGE